MLLLRKVFYFCVGNVFIVLFFQSTDIRFEIVFSSLCECFEIAFESHNFTF